MTDNTKLFEFIHQAVTGECGDGDMAVVFTAQDHKIVADEFEKFLATKSYGSWERRTFDNGDIHFWDHQESFTFSNNDHFCYWHELRDNPEETKGKEPCTQKVVTP